jgi:glycerol-3-phosphate dehydrogenase
MTDTGVVVVGGGSTGTGVARDLAMRGVDVTLLERGTLASGTTGRMHGLLHSGGRYAVADPESARACVAENRVLREIAPHCVEETGGLFVQRPEDDDDYFERKLAACRDCGVPAEALSGEEARTEEPNLASDVERAVRVPDAAVDPFGLAVATAASAAEHGARVEPHAEVVDVLVEAGAVAGVAVEHGSGPGKRADREPGRREEIRARHVVNATGAWAGRFGGMAGVGVPVRLSRGAMTVTEGRTVDTVVNRCRPKAEGDIVVPHGTACILGATDREVADPDDVPGASAEVDRLLDELARVVPALRAARTLRSFWGVRPLYEPPGTGTENPTDVTRTHALLDHAERDGVDGLLTVVGGKLTTHRLMAEAAADRVCAALGVDADCRTADEPLPGIDDPSVLRERMEAFGLASPDGDSRLARGGRGNRSSEGFGDAA